MSCSSPSCCSDKKGCCAKLCGCHKVMPTCRQALSDFQKSVKKYKECIESVELQIFYLKLSFKHREIGPKTFEHRLHKLEKKLNHCVRRLKQVKKEHLQEVRDPKENVV